MFFNRSFEESENKIKEHMSDYTSNSKHRTEKLKAKNQKQKPEKPKHRKTKTYFYGNNRQKMQTYIKPY